MLKIFSNSAEGRTDYEIETKINHQQVSIIYERHLYPLSLPHKLLEDSEIENAAIPCLQFIVQSVDLRAGLEELNKLTKIIEVEEVAFSRVSLLREEPLAHDLDQLFCIP